MERGQRQTLIEAIETERISAIIRTSEQSKASEAMEAAVEGGFRMVEFTLTTPASAASSQN